MNKASRCIVQLTSDSQGMVNYLDDILEKFQVSGVLSPGAPLSKVITYPDTSTLSKSNYVILNGGENNILNNNNKYNNKCGPSEYINLLKTKVKLCSHTDLMLSTVP